MELRRFRPGRRAAGMGVALALAIGVWSAMRRTPDDQPVYIEEPTVQWQAARVYEMPKAIAPFHLVDHTGRGFDLARIKGRWSFLFFGYTHCPDICPLTLSVFKEVQRRLTEAGQGSTDVQLVFVSVDPERDTPQELRKYVSYFGPDLVGVTGSDRQLRALTRQLGIFYRFVEQHGVEGYVVEHSGSVLLVDPQARLYAVFPGPHDAQKIAATYLQMRSRSDGKPP
jgi:protein SCO1